MQGARKGLRAIEGGAGKASDAEFCPVAPSYLAPEALQAWRVVVDDLKARKLLTPAAMGAINGYAMAVWQAAECSKAIQKHGAFVLSDKRQPKAHPAMATLQKATELITRLAGELGLTPAARVRKGLDGSQEGGSDEGAPTGLDI